MNNTSLGDLLGAASDPLSLAGTAAGSANSPASANSSTGLSGLFSGLTQLANTGVSAYNAVANPGSTSGVVATGATGAATTTSSGGLGSYVPVAILGGAVFLAFLVFRRK